MFFLQNHNEEENNQKRRFSNKIKVNRYLDTLLIIYFNLIKNKYFFFMFSQFKKLLIMKEKKLNVMFTF